MSPGRGAGPAGAAWRRSPPMAVPPARRAAALPVALARSVHWASAAAAGALACREPVVVGTPSAGQAAPWPAREARGRLAVTGWLSAITLITALEDRAIPEIATDRNERHRSRVTVDLRQERAQHVSADNGIEQPPVSPLARFVEPDAEGAARPWHVDVDVDSCRSRGWPNTAEGAPAARAHAAPPCPGRMSACAPSLPFSASSLRSCPDDAARSCCLRAATKIKAQPPYPAIGPPTCYFLVAGTGFEPATSGL